MFSGASGPSIGRGVRWLQGTLAGGEAGGIGFAPTLLRGVALRACRRDGAWKRCLSLVQIVHFPGEIARTEEARGDQSHSRL